MAPEPYRLYLDQMFGVHVARALRGTGFDVMRASEVGQSRADDAQVLRKAVDEKRILITLDGHFGDWVVLPLGRHAGVIRLRVNPTTTSIYTHLTAKTFDAAFRSINQLMNDL